MSQVVREVLTPEELAFVAGKISEKTWTMPLIGVLGLVPLVVVAIVGFVRRDPILVLCACGVLVGQLVGDMAADVQAQVRERRLLKKLMTHYGAMPDASGVNSLPPAGRAPR